MNHEQPSAEELTAAGQAQLDNAAVESVRDIVIDVLKTLHPTTGRVLLSEINRSMTHISKRLDRVQAFDAAEVAKLKEAKP